MNILDEITDAKPMTRKVYGVRHSEKPNNHCVWNADFGLWEEDDDHYRSRILESATEANK